MEENRYTEQTAPNRTALTSNRMSRLTNQTEDTDSEWCSKQKDYTMFYLLDFMHFALTTALHLELGWATGVLSIDFMRNHLERFSNSLEKVSTCAEHMLRGPAHRLGFRSDDCRPLVIWHSTFHKSLVLAWKSVQCTDRSSITLWPPC